MYEQIIEFMNTPVFMYLMVVWAIMLPAFLYAFHYHWEIAAMEETCSLYGKEALHLKESLKETT